MFIIDDLLMAPMNGVLWIFKEIHEAAEQERANEADNITAELQKLYRSLESGDISEEEFESRESVLLDRLDSIEGIETDSESEEEYEDEDVDEHSSVSVLDER